MALLPTLVAAAVGIGLGLRWGGSFHNITQWRPVLPLMGAGGVTLLVLNDVVGLSGTPAVLWRIVALGLVVAFGLQWSVVKTAFGARLRAAVDNQRVARGMGIDVNRVFSLTFALGSALAGLGGALGVEMLGLDPEFPVKYLVYFLIVVSVGGSGNILGSLYAAILLGVADVVGKYYIPQIGAFIIYAVMVATLILRPHGLFGRPHK